MERSDESNKRIISSSVAKSPPVRHCGTTRVRKDWESGEWTTNLKLPPLGIPPRLRGKDVDSVHLLC